VNNLSPVRYLSE